VSGISGYGNSVGVPTVGGETVFEECYAENPLVNVFCLGVLPVDRLVLGQATGVGNLAVLLGSTTGRDGIGGVSVLASAGFGDAEAEEAKRPSVQVGDPFEEKRLIEACLDLLDRGLVVGVQDLGGAGLTCATSETASKGGVGMDVYVSEVPQREPGMEPFEVMTSESQERMLAIVTPQDLDEVLAVAAATLRLKAPGVDLPSHRGLAVSSDGNHRWCAVDPRAGTAMVVAESALNVACAGARPAALVNCLNFGNPEHPVVMWQLSEAI